MAKYNNTLKLTNLASNEEIAKNFMDEAGAAYENYSSMREQYEDVWEVADYMYKCAQNRTLNASEKSIGANDDDDNRANLGSTVFHRQITQMASHGVAVELSKPEPFKFEPINNSGIYDSMEEGEAEANQLNALMRYTLKHDAYKQKTTDFWFNACKYGNTAISVNWRLQTKNVKRRIPTYETSVDVNGEETAVQTGYKDTEEEVIIKAYPSQNIINLSQIYADPHIGNIQDQTTVIVLSIVHKADILNEVTNGIYDKALYEKLDLNDVWDGDTGSDFKQKLMENSGLSYEESSVRDQYLKWDIYHRAPIDGGSWNEENIPVWYYGVVIGNDVASGKPMTIIRNVDPDDEVPIEMIHTYPDDSDLLYHTAPAEVIRSNYSSECTLKEAAIDNMCFVNRPVIVAVEGMHYVKDFTFKKDQIWKVTSPDAITQMPVRDNTQSTIGMLEYIKQDSNQALAVDKNQMGEAYGGRTSATEAMNINSLSSQPDLVLISYVLEQRLRFIAKKFASYWRTFGTPCVIERISDVPLIPNIQPTNLKGDFDIEINIVDEYKSDQVSSQALRDIVRMVAQSPELLKSETHQIDVGELMKEVFVRAGLNGDRYVKSPQGGDANRAAILENIAMTQNGQAVQVNPDDNDIIHLRVHRGERLRYNGVEDQFPNVAVLDQHIKEHELQEQQGSGGGGAGSGQVAPPGQAVTGGQQAGADLGAAMGGQA